MASKKAVPTPPIPIKDISCSVIYQNTLYTYSSSGVLQSLSLEAGAEWKELSKGMPVTGGVCVSSTPVKPREPGLFVVGGKGPDGYRGLQKFTYSTGQWELQGPVSEDVMNRLGHGAAYINSTDAILVYAGNKDGTIHAGSQTFTIGASAPFEVRSFNSDGVPPLANPMLLPWSNNQAALVGGEGNTKVILFSPETGGWKDSGATLAAPLSKDVSVMRAAVVAGTDGSKSLYTFDTSQSPNLVTRSTLIDAQGQPKTNSPALSTRAENEDQEWRLIERQAEQWPKYNSTFAPKATRTNFALAQDPNGMIVLAGGTDGEPIDIFNGRANTWMDTPGVFSTDTLRTLDTDSSSSSVSVASSTSASPTPSASPSSTSTSTSVISSVTPSSSSEPTLVPGAGVPANKPDSYSSIPPVNTILGAVLGTTAAVLILLGILYCLLRRKKKRDELEAGNANRDSGLTPLNEKSGVMYAADGLPRGPGNGTFRGHQQQDSQGSFSSMAILMGKVNQQHKQAAVQRNPSKESKRSSESSILNSAFKKSISNPIPHPASPNPFADPAPPLPQAQMRDEKGGTVVFSNDVGEPRPRPARPDRPDGTRRSSGWNRYWSGGSTLNILGFGSGASKRTTVASDSSSRYSANVQNRITQDSATVPHLAVGGSRLPEPTPEFQRVNSASPTISASPQLGPGMKGRIERPTSTGSDRSGYSSGIPASVHDNWDPTGADQPWGSNRAPSSAYNYNSAYNSVYSTALAPPSSSSSRPALPSGVSTQPQLAMAANSSDMSWLNLGEDKKKNFY
ncbi:hypothetical protein PspLS_07565 [Pyricularia sp. CBS 133598]|nr:hypothetical protein PspLS_07565 [Pyricularia sp. CBS 133598]